MQQNNAALLQQLQDSILFQPDFPRRITYTHAEWRRLPDEQKGASHQPGLEAINRAREIWPRLRDAVTAIGAARHEPAIPTLAHLWRHCALAPIRTATGHALYRMRTESAWNELASMIDDSAHPSAYLGAKATIERDPVKAYDDLAPRFKKGPSWSPEIGNTALQLLTPNNKFFEKGELILAPVHEWLQQEPRWLELCARLRRDPLFGASAREVLRHAEPAARRPVLERTKAIETLRREQTRVPPVGKLVPRYCSGQFESVWREIRSHEHLDGHFRAEVFEVARETMKRVARNADLLSERLHVRGWKALCGSLRTKPSPNLGQIVAKFEAASQSPIPPSLLAFWTEVGGVDWIWNYNLPEAAPHLGVDLYMVEMDPLSISDPDEAAWVLEDWKEALNEADPDLVEPFNLILAPDVYHKADISGGPPYEIGLPFLGADPVLGNERHCLPFVDYLRLCFRWAGFPGLEQYAEREDVQRFVAKFGAGLEPF
jgi:hypothetical protein